MRIGIGIGDCMIGVDVFAVLDQKRLVGVDADQLFQRCECVGSRGSIELFAEQGGANDIGAVDCKSGPRSDSRAVWWRR